MADVSESEVFNELGADKDFEAQERGHNRLLTGLIAAVVLSLLDGVVLPQVGASVHAMEQVGVILFVTAIAMFCGVVISAMKLSK